MEIAGKVAIVTGASEGIGAACARLLAERGARLVLAARSEEKLRKVGGPGAVIVAGDLTEAVTRQRLVEQARQAFGQIDILINNAGVGLYQPAWRAPMDQVRWMMELNFFAPLDLIQRVAPVMAEQGRGVIVNVSSIAGKVTLPWMTLYSASKYALCSLSDGVRMELKSRGIHVVSVCPGYVTTGFHQHVLGGDVPPSVKRSRKLPITAEKCAAAIVESIEKEKRTVVVPAAGWLFVAFARLLPWLLDSKLEQLYRELEQAS